MSKNANRVTKKPETHAAPKDAIVQSAAVEIKPDPEAVRRHAYALYLERARAGAPGDEFTDWVRAERELVGRA